MGCSQACLLVRYLLQAQATAEAGVGTKIMG